jgi:hypothetical protein
MSAKIYRFPSTFRRRPIPPLTVRPVRYRGRGVHADGFAVLLPATLVAVFFYLSGAGGMARHDGLYAALLLAIWGLYFFRPPLLRVRVLGPLLIGAGRVLVVAGFVGFFGGIYCLIFSHG